ncbi:MAG TPA: NAD-dependent epimerase/dehydratase family protein [Gammaproteobacteria bacterium]|nr:NAD-dependent epimerase/dehydratase family protein [Gammaproteobacteria bacterium]
MNSKLLIVGCGDVGKRVLQQLPANQHSVSVISHQTSPQVHLQTYGVHIIHADLDKSDNPTLLTTNNSHVFYFAPPTTTGIQDLRMQNFLNQINKDKPPKRIVYISTTGVYGNCNNEWVTEKTTLNPVTDRSKRRVHAESLIQKFCASTSCEYIILRVAGIYCFEKLPLNRLKEGIKVLKQEIAPCSNRIHADDLATCCINAMFNNRVKNDIFNVSDGTPSSMTEYFIQIAKMFNLPAPIELDWKQAEETLSANMLSYLRESKKINIQKLMIELNINLKYPTLKQGLEQCYSQHQHYS